MLETASVPDKQSLLKEADKQSLLKGEETSFTAAYTNMQLPTEQL